MEVNSKPRAPSCRSGTRSSVLSWWGFEEGETNWRYGVARLRDLGQFSGFLGDAKGHNIPGVLIADQQEFAARGDGKVAGGFSAAQNALNEGQGAVVRADPENTNPVSA